MSAAVIDLDDVVRGYLVAILWTSTTFEGGTLNSGYGVDDIAPESVAEAREELRQFIESETEDLEGIDADAIGHDFCLTRNHHGTGFWDRGLGERGDRLTVAAHAWGSADAYVGDDGKVYLS